MDYSPWGQKESDTTEQFHFASLHFRPFSVRFPYLEGVFFFLSVGVGVCVSMSVCVCVLMGILYCQEFIQPENKLHCKFFCNSNANQEGYHSLKC